MTDPLLSALTDADTHAAHLRAAQQDACDAMVAQLRAAIPAAAWLDRSCEPAGYPWAWAYAVGTRCPVTVAARVAPDLSGVRWRAWVDVDRERCVVTSRHMRGWDSPVEALRDLLAEVQAAHRRARRPDVRSDLWRIEAALNRWLAGAP